MMRALVGTVRWCRDDMSCARGVGSHGRDSKTRPQMRDYALRVAIALVGSATCVHCDAPIGLHTGEVDRTRPGACYLPGSVIMICPTCNRDREDGDAINTEQYARDVARASVGIDPLPISEARALYGASRARYATLSRSRYWRG